MSASSGEKPVKCGVARLVGKLMKNLETKDLDKATDIDVVITEVPVTLGRAESGPGHVNINMGSVQSQNISRQHLKIFYDGSSAQFKLEVTSKNGVDVNTVKHSMGDVVVLKPKASIRAGNALMYWLPAVSTFGTGKSPTKGSVLSYAKLMKEAFETDPALKSALHDPAVGVTSGRVRDWIKQHHADMYDDEKKLNNLTAGVYCQFNSKAASNPYARVAATGGGSEVFYFWKGPAGGTGAGNGTKSPQTMET
jgi:hypothetical protein